MLGIQPVPLHRLQEHPGGSEGCGGRNAGAAMTTYKSPAFEKGRTSVLGHTVIRLEDVPLVTGRGRYVADIELPAPTAHADCAVRSAHGRIVRVG